MLQSCFAYSLQRNPGDELKYFFESVDHAVDHCGDMSDKFILIKIKKNLIPLWIFFVGTSSEERKRGHRQFSSLICQTILLTQIE